jgi:hypothetical protein
MLGQTVALSTPPPALAPRQAYGANSRDMVLSVPKERPLATFAMLRTPASVDEAGGMAMDMADELDADADADEDGLLAGALKKTGTSIVKTGVKTGSSLLVAFRAVGGAVRRVLPDFN